jgi:hypothetical protein
LSVSEGRWRWYRCTTDHLSSMSASERPVAVSHTAAVHGGGVWGCGGRGRRARTNRFHRVKRPDRLLGRHLHGGHRRACALDPHPMRARAHVCGGCEARTTPLSAYERQGTTHPRRRELLSTPRPPPATVTRVLSVCVCLCAHSLCAQTYAAHPCRRSSGRGHGRRAGLLDHVRFHRV